MSCVFVLLSFFPLPYTVCLSVFVLKRFTILSFKPLTEKANHWQKKQDMYHLGKLILVVTKL